MTNLLFPHCDKLFAAVFNKALAYIIVGAIIIVGQAIHDNHATAGAEAFITG